MSSLELLRAIAAASEATVDEQLPPHVVRFTLEFAGSSNPAAERARLEVVLATPVPPLFALDPDLPQFLVLQFADVPRRVSTPGLFAMADLLTRELNLVSCTPDVGVRGLEPATDDDLATESAVGDRLMNLTCKTTNPAPTVEDWAARSVRADRVRPQTGLGIRIAQPDTGVADHPAIMPGLDADAAFNVMTNQPGAIDPLRSGSGNPGHGTATSSVVIGQSTVSGVAPGAKVIPIRTIESVVVFDGAPIARAIMYAIRNDAHVITMSLGGLFFSPALKAALAQAVANNVIVCAAAGNCVQPIVVYPASDRSVHAVGGIGPWDAPWRGSSRGAKVAFSAPAENVFVARRAPGDGGVPSVHPSEGTSFATAAAAGVAALWLAHHKRNTVIDEAQRRGVSVQHLFLLAAVKSIRGPETGTWDRRYGAGILDAEALLSIPLAEIPSVVPRVEGVEDEALDDQTRALIEVVTLAAEPEQDSSFDWAKFGPEAVYLAGDAASWHRRVSSKARSSRSPPPAWSPLACRPPYSARSPRPATNRRCSPRYRGATGPSNSRGPAPRNWRARTRRGRRLARSC